MAREVGADQARSAAARRRYAATGPGRGLTWPRPALVVRAIGRLAIDPAFLVVAGCWVAASLYLLSIQGARSPLISLALYLPVLIGLGLYGLIVKATPPPQDRLETAALTRRMQAEQLRAALLFAIMAFVTFVGLGVVYNQMYGAFIITHPFFYGPDPLTFAAVYAVLPVGLLIMLRASPRSLGLTVKKPWAAVTAIGMLGPAAILVLRGGDLLVLPGVIVVAGVFIFAASEEVLFRGALQTRLAAVVGRKAALVAASLMFGVAHAGKFMFFEVSDNMLAAIAFTVTSQAMGGLVYGLMLDQTGSLLPPMLSHAAWNLALMT